MLYGFSQIDAGLLSSNVVLSRFFLLSVDELTSGESRESVIYISCVKVVLNWFDCHLHEVSDVLQVLW